MRNKAFYLIWLLTALAGAVHAEPRAMLERRVNDEGPGTFFNPSDGNAASTSVTVTNAVARRTVGFLGGSITEMNGFRPLLMAALRKQCPDVEFVEIAAGLSSTCSDTGAFRLERDVLKRGMPDVLIVDVAVNDDQDGRFDEAHCIRGLEGIVRRMLMVNPRCRIVIAEMVNKVQFEQLLRGEEPIPYAAGRIVANHYGAAVADVGSALVAASRTGRLSWEEYRDCHPSPEGCSFGAQIVLETVNRTVDFRKVMPHRALPDPLDPFSYFSGSELDFKTACSGAGWQVLKPDWDTIPGLKRSYFTQGEVLCCAQTNEMLTVRFSGTALAALLTAGPDAGDLEVSVDGGAFRHVPLRAEHEPLHYPYTQLLADDLEDCSHEVHVRIRPARRESRIGTNVRINRLYANGARSGRTVRSRALNAAFLFEDRRRLGKDSVSGYDCLSFESDGSEIYGQILKPDGSYGADRPCVLLFHGFAGFATLDDIGHALCRAGCVVVIPHHRGAWGSQGKYLFSNCVQDAVNLVRHVRGSSFVRKYSTSPDAVFLVGHSMGGNTVLNAAGRVEGVRGVVMLDPCDIGSMALRMAPSEMRSFLSENGLSVLRTDGVDALLGDVAEHAHEFAFPNSVSRLNGVSLFLADATWGLDEGDSLMSGLQAAAQRNKGITHYRRCTYPGKHGLMGRRVQLTKDIADFIRQNL